MTAVLQSPSHLPSSPSSSLSCSANDGSRQTRPVLNEDDPSTATEGEGEELETEEERGSSVVKGLRRERDEQEEEEESNQLSLFALLLTLFRRSLVGCSAERGKDTRSMEIGWPTEVRHVAHVTFDRFHGFLGLPVEFEPEVPTRAPSASTTVFGVSTQSMQCSYDSRGNSIPTILLMMQRRLYAQGGLQSEGIFRITADNTQEEHVRDQLNSGIIPDGIDVHCLAGLIKAWFRELPNGVLDCLTPEQVLECQSEEDYVQLVRLLPPTESALLDWAVNLMADVVQEEQHNKMNAHNVATVFAPNMTQMADPLTALMHAVQVMNLLKTLILRVLRERQEPVIDGDCASPSEPSDDNGHHSPSRLNTESCTEGESEQPLVCNEPVLDKPSDLPEDNLTTADAMDTSDVAHKKSSSEVTGCSTDDQPSKVLAEIDNSANGSETAGIQASSCRKKTRPPSNLNLKKAPKKPNGQPVVIAPVLTEKSRGISTLSRLNSRMERAEAWR